VIAFSEEGKVISGGKGKGIDDVRIPSRPHRRSPAD
jgi:hypothetical protein